MIKKIALAFVLTSMGFAPVFPQIPKESWRDHLAYNRGTHLAVTPNKVYYAAYKSGMLSYNRKTGEIEKYSKVKGLSDIDISSIAYAPKPEILIIGYRSGDIDFITHKGLINLPDIVRKRMVSSKAINKIYCVDDLAYLACDFGIVVLDLSKLEIKDSYFFGPEGNIIKVNDVTVFDNNIFAATKMGLYKADLNNPNLLDYSNWILQTNVPEPNSEFKFVCSLDDKMVAVYNTASAGNGLIINTNNSWSDWNISHDSLINDIDVYNNTLSVIDPLEVTFYNSQLQKLSSYDVPNARHALMAGDGMVFTAGLGYGFYSFAGGEGHYYGVVNPRFNTTGIVATNDNYVWVGSGGPFRKYFQGGAFIFDNEHWISLNNGYTPGLEDIGNLYKFAFYPGDPADVFASGYLYGIYEINNYNVVKSYTWQNTPLFQKTLDKDVGVRAMGFGFDSYKNLWAVMDETDQPVYVLRNSSKEWENLELKSQIFSSNNLWADLTITNNNQIWLLTRKNGIAVLKEQQDGTISEKTFPLKNQDGDLLTIAYCMTLDKDGNIWIGTNKGPIIYYPSDDIFNQTDVRGYQVKIPRNDGENGADFLLDYEIINSIAVDGGNRKWIATENSGVFLVSSDGKKTIHNFTFENSPLISDNVIGIGVQEKTGEVFMSTNYGIVSYMGSATVGSDDYSNVYVFPNPVRPGYTGDITITGLMANSNVKITDISGNIVYETTSNGGQATWDGRNLDGNKASTGVYLVFLTNEDGSKTHITKLLFIH